MSHCGEWCPVLFHRASLWLVGGTGRSWCEDKRRHSGFNSWDIPQAPSPLSCQCCCFDNVVFIFCLPARLENEVFAMWLFVPACCSVSRPGCQLAVPVCLLSRHFTDSQWLRAAWSASLSWPDFKIDGLARTPWTHSIAKTGLSLYSVRSHVRPSLRSGFEYDSLVMRLMSDRLREQTVEGNSHRHNASDCHLTGTHTHPHTHSVFWFTD